MTLVADRPLPGEPRAWSFPAFQRNGRTITCHVPGKPLAVASVVFGDGAVSEATGREGISQLLTTAMTYGTKRLDAFEFALATERLGADISVSAEWDSLRAMADAPVSEFPAAVALLAEVLRTPGLTSDTLDRIRRERLDEIAIESSQPTSRAARELSCQLFSPTSRFSQSTGGSAAGVTASSDLDIHRLWQQRLDPASATLILVGDVTAMDVESLSASVFDGWESGSPTTNLLDVTTRDEGRRIVLVDRPDAVQSVIFAGHVGPPRDIPDYVATTTMAMALGGMFASRLNLKLREEKGYAYGAAGGFDLKRQAGLFVARSAVQTDVTAPALIDLVGEIERTARDGITESERDDAVAYRSGVFPIQFSSVHAVARGLGDLVVHGWAEDHFDALRRDVMAVTADELSAAARDRLRPDDLVMVVVGDASKVEQSLRDSGLGPVSVVSDAE